VFSEPGLSLLGNKSFFIIHDLFFVWFHKSLWMDLFWMCFDVGG
jgi:hypothetical protein